MIQLMAASAALMMTCAYWLGYIHGKAKRQYRDPKGRFRKSKEQCL